MRLRSRFALRSFALLVVVLLTGTTGSMLSYGGTVRALAVAPNATADIPEDGVSGEIPLLDQLDGKSALGYRRGIGVVSTNPILNRGANFAMA